MGLIFIFLMLNYFITVDSSFAIIIPILKTVKFNYLNYNIKHDWNNCRNQLDFEASSILLYPRDK